jgi:hypothetical protein
MDDTAIDSNLNVLNDNLGVIDQKVSQLLLFLSNQEEQTKLPAGFKEQEMERLRDKLFSDEKKEKTLLRRFNQKRRIFQAVPITIDSITPDGQKGIRKALKNLLTFNIDKKELEDKKTGLWGMIAALIVGLIAGLIAFLKDKLKGLEAWWKGLKLGEDLGNVFKSIRDKLWKGFKNSKLGQIFDDIAKSLRESKFGKFMRELKIPRFWQTENFLKALKEIKTFTKQLKELPGYIRNLNVDELTEYLKEKKYAFGVNYGGGPALAQNKQKLQMLDELLKFRQEGYSIEKLIDELETTTKQLDKPKPLFQKALQGFGKAFNGFINGAKNILASLAGKLGDAVKALEKIPGVGTVIRKIPYIGSVISTLDTIFQLVERKIKGEKIDDAALTAAATTIGLNVVGWFSGFLFPLAFLTLKQIEPIIRKIFEEQDTLNKLGLIFSAIPEVLYKGIGMFMKFLIADLPYWIGKAWDSLFGDKKEGPYLTFFKFFSQELEDFFTNFSLGTELQKIGHWIGEGVVHTGIQIRDFFSKIFTAAFWKDAWNKITGKSKRTLEQDFADAKYIEDMLEDIDGTRKKTELPVKKAGDLISTKDKVLFSGQQAFRFSKNDQFFAVRKGGPIDNIVESFSIKTKESNEKLLKEVKDLNKKFSSLENFYKESLLLQAKQLKAVDSHIPFLKDIRNKDFSSNILMNNRPNNIVVNNSETSALRYRSNIARSVV